MEIAAQIQQSLLPSQPPRVPGLALAGRCVSAAMVGGDYYDFIVDSDGRVYLLIADVTGHSVGSALMMATARNVLRREVDSGRPPGEVLRAVNDSMLADLTNAALFITMFCARFDPGTGELSFASGGHNPPLLRRSTSGAVITLDPDGMPAGLLGGVEYVQESTSLQPGDVLLMYTDGAVEARSPDGEQFGLERLRQIMASSAGQEPEELVSTVFGQVQSHTGGNASQDDLTLLACVRTAAS
jgi:sigma-B regulation protein RsbU (phosphoserine phosphatase)